MKEKILAAIKAKFPKVNLSKKRLDAIAAKIEAKVIDDETKIDATIDEFDSFMPLADIAKQDDALRNLEAKTKPAPKKDDANPPAEPDDLNDDTPAWAKALMKQNETLAQTVAAMQGKEVATTIRGKASEKLKDIPASYWSKRAIPETEEGLDAFVEEVTSDFATFQQELTDKGLATIPIPGGGQGAAPKAQAISPEVKAFAEKQAAQATAK